MNSLAQYRLISFQKNYVVWIILAILVSFWQCLSMPFIQDDWVWLSTFKQYNDADLIAFFFDIHNLFYRPFAQLYFLILYKIFGSDALPFHVISLLIHILNSLLIVIIFRCLTKDELISALSGLIYGVAVSTHLDTLSWMVGMYDIGAAFFFFLSIWIFIKKHYFLSALAFLIAALFKESVVILPLVLILLKVFFDERDSLKIFSLKIFPFLIISGLMFFIKTRSSESLIKLSANHPYAIEFVSGQVIVNLCQYLSWMSQAIAPFEIRIISFIILALISVTTILICTLKWKRPDKLFLLLFLILWVLFCLLPVLFLTNHSYRYYAIYSLPAFICFVLILLKETLVFIGFSELKTRKIILVIGSLVVFSSIVQSNRIFKQGLEQRIFIDGSNMLVRRAAYVDIVQKFLLNYYPTLPNNASLIFDNIDIWAFNKEAGPRVWYNNKTLNVYELKNLRYDSSKWFIRNPINNQLEIGIGSNQKDIFLNEDDFYVFSLAEGEIRRINNDELK